MHLYIHIPFCKQACHYCDFHFSTNTASKRDIVEAITKEIIVRKSYLPTSKISTIYIGGGTPSLLDQFELNLLLTNIYSNFEVDHDAEITLEANPDDLSKAKLEQIRASGINRLSIGIQSFYEPHLRFLNRAHNASEAEGCVKNAQDAGIENISIDLIYAIPFQDHSILERDIQRAFQLNTAHISAYCLTIEPQTAFGNWLKKKKIKPIDEEFSARQFEILISSLAAKGYEQYEISNFARNEQYSRHNTSYWQQKPYLGVGPSAHSYNRVSRQYNVANNAKYLGAIQTDSIPATIEQLSTADQTNEYLLTGLRTKWGVEMGKLDSLSNGVFEKRHQTTVSLFVEQNLISFQNNVITLTQNGKLFADKITGDLFIE